jgi:hypothetical protein
VEENSFIFPHKPSIRVEKTMEIVKIDEYGVRIA